MLLYVVQHQLFSIVEQKMAVSPGRFTSKHTIWLANRLKKQRLKQSQPSCKRRRLELKAARLSKEAARNILEGNNLV